MDQQIIECQYVLLRHQIRIALAFYMFKNCYQSVNMREYLEEFQNSYRIIRRKCNISVERKMFLQQMMRLLPSSRSDDFQSQEPLPIPTPMQVDVDGTIDPVYVNFSLKLMTVTELLDGLRVLKTVLKLESVSSEDIFRILSKFGDLDVNFRFRNSRIIKISDRAIEQLLKYINTEEIAKECVIEILNLFNIYLDVLPQEQSLSSEEALVWMKRANEVIMKCIDSFACERLYQDMILNLLHKSVELTFVQKSKNEHYGMFRYHLIRRWRYHKLLCINVLNIFFNSLEDIKKGDSLKKRKCFIILNFTKLFLEMFCETHYKKSKNITIVASRNSSNRSKNYVIPSDIKCLKTWARSLARLITSYEYESSTLTSLAHSCFKIISSVKELQYFIQKRRI